MKITQVMDLIPQLSKEELFMVKIRVEHYIKNCTKIKNKQRQGDRDIKKSTQIIRPTLEKGLEKITTSKQTPCISKTNQ